MSPSAREPPTLSPALLERLPQAVRRPGYDRKALAVGMAHVGVGAFHRCHQADYTDDLLNEHFDRWGVIGINIREPRLAGTLARQDGLYTRLLRDGDHIDARVIGCMLATADSQADAGPALKVLAAPEVDVITLTVTEKGYCHKPSTGLLDASLPDVAHDLANPDEPRTLPGMLAKALELRMQSHGRPVTVISCDNIPSNGVILANVVRAVTERRSPELASWIADHVAFPSTMVDRIVPATSETDRLAVEETFGYRDLAPVVGEPFRQWVIENRFASRAPQWHLAGATLVDNVAPFELLKMRVLNAAQSSLAYLGLLAGHTYSGEAADDPLLAAFVRRMLIEESLPTLPPVPGVSPTDYVEQTFRRLHNTAIRHRNHQIATDGSQKIVQRLLNPIRERLHEGKGVELLSVVVAAWMVYLVYASRRFGQRWAVQDPFAGEIARIADRTGDDGTSLAAAILANETLFSRELFERGEFRSMIGCHLDGLLSDRPIGYVQSVLDRVIASTHAAGNRAG